MRGSPDVSGNLELTPIVRPLNPLLRPAQSRILHYTQGKLGISAVPGSGKTFTIEQLVLKLIADGTPPHRIGIATYMRSSRANLAARLQRHLSEQRIRGRVEIFTLHSLSLRILKELLPGFSQVILQEQYEQDRLLYRLVNQWMRTHESIWKAWLPEGSAQYLRSLRGKVRGQLSQCLQRVIAMAKNYRLLPHAIAHRPHTILAWTMEMYARYQETLTQQGKIDYNDLAWQAVDLLERDLSARSVAQSWFDYVFEDEAQDSSPLQEQLLQILSDKSANLIRVGDPNQSIMSTFTNADPLLFREFCRSHSSTIQTLEESSRSALPIIQLANYLVDWVSLQHPDPRLRSALIRQHIQPASTGMRNPTLEECAIAFLRISGEAETELQRIAELAAQALALRPHHSIAILVQTNDQGSTLLEMLRQRGERSVALLRHHTSGRQLMELLMGISEFLADPVTTGVILQCLEAICPYVEVSPDQAAIVANALSRSWPEDLLYPLLGQPIALPAIPEIEPAVVEKVKSILRLLAHWLTLASLPWDELLRIVVQHLQRSVEDLYVGNYVIEQLEQALRHNLLAEWSDIATEMRALLERPLQNLPAEIRNYTPQPGTITVLTAHRSKGLEWDEVYVVSCSAYNFPVLIEEHPEGIRLQGDVLHLQAEVLVQLKQAMGIASDQISSPESSFLESAAERLRLLYVAITRAKKRLTLSVPTQWYDHELKSSQVFDRLEAFMLHQQG